MQRNWFIVLALLLIAVLGPRADAAVTATPVFPQTPNLGIVGFVQGTDTAGTYKTVYTGNANGSKCVALIASSTDTAVAHLVTVQLNRTSGFTVVAANVPINAGSANAVPPVSLMSTGVWVGLPIDSDGNPFIYLKNASDTIQATFTTALTASTQINIMAVCSDF